jgi:hypothetical protein
MPDTAWPVGGHPPGLSRNSWYIPVSMSPVYVTARHQRFACARLPDPYLTHPVRLFPHRSPQQSSANAAVSGLKPPPAGRLRRAYLHLPRSTASRNSAYIKLLSAFVTHTSTYAFEARFRVVTVRYAAVGTEFPGPYGLRTRARAATDGTGGSGPADRPPGLPPLTCHFRMPDRAADNGQDPCGRTSPAS